MEKRGGLVLVISGLWKRSYIVSSVLGFCRKKGRQPVRAPEFTPEEAPPSGLWTGNRRFLAGRGGGAGTGAWPGGATSV